MAETGGSIDGVQWFATLGGEVAFLDELRERLTFCRDFRLEKRGSEHRLLGPCFCGLQTEDEVFASAQQVVARMNLAGMLRIDGFRPVNVRAVAQIQADGSENYFVRAADPAAIGVLGRSVVMSIGGATETLRPEGLELLFAVLTTSPKIEQAAHYVLHEPNWYGYYKAFEAICEHVGNPRRLKRQGWATRGDIGRFKWSAQPLRHHNIEPPTNPMSEAEARAFALALIERAVAEALAKVQVPT